MPKPSHTHTHTHTHTHAHAHTHTHVWFPTSSDTRPLSPSSLILFPLLPRYAFIFDADCTSSIQSSALEFAAYVAELLSDHNAPHGKALFREIFSPYCGGLRQLTLGNFPRLQNRAEWGGLRWTSQIVEANCRYAALQPPSASGESLDSWGLGGDAGGLPGDEADFLPQLYTLTCTFPSGLMDQACAMWIGLCKSFLQPLVAGKGGNIAAILDFLLNTAGGSKDTPAYDVSVCKEIALAVYEYDKEGVADALAAPLHFGQQSDMCRVRSSVVLLAQLSRSDIEPILPHLAAAVNFALVSFPCDAKRTQAGKAGGGGGSDAFLDESVRLLLHNLVASLRPFLIAEEKPVSRDLAAKADILLAQLRAPTFKVHWPMINVPLERTSGGAYTGRSAPPAVPQSPNAMALAMGGATAHISKHAGATGQVGVVALDPTLYLANDATAKFIRDIASLFAVAVPSISEDLGLEALLWALHSKDRDTCIRGQHVFR